MNNPTAIAIARKPSYARSCKAMMHNIDRQKHASVGSSNGDYDAFSAQCRLKSISFVTEYRTNADKVVLRRLHSALISSSN
jgi:hypothetical protein